MSQQKRNTALLLLIILLLFLSLQMLYAYFDRAPDYDESIYLYVAKTIKASGLPYRFFGADSPFLMHPPLFYYILTGFLIILGNQLFVARLVSTVFSLAIIILVYLIVSKYKGKEVGLVSIFILAINPAFLYYSHSVYMEITLAFLSLMSIFLFLKGEEEKKTKFFVWSGVFLGLSLITKYYSVILFLFFFLYFVIEFKWTFFYRPQFYSWLFPVVFLFMLWLGFGYWVGKDAFTEQTLGWFRKPLGNLYSWRLVSNFVYFKEMIGAITPIFSLLFLYGIFKWLKNIIKNREIKFMNILPIYFFMYFVYFIKMPFKDIKYIIPLLPLMVIATGVNIDTHSLNLRRYSGFKYLALGLALVIVVVGLSPLSVLYDPTTHHFHDNLYQFGIKRDYEYRIYKDIGEFLKSKLKISDTIACQNKAPIIGVYAETIYINLWSLSIEEMKQQIFASDAVVMEEGLPYIGDIENRGLQKEMEVKFFLVKTMTGRDGKKFWIYLRKSEFENEISISGSQRISFL
ncbi:MAG: glycosyltransferase family 39 protein [candidate division Zixibacteria bacterium]|nr:glycosyltransferase family 39 protein [candidate division Zixibacteria bacterium]